MCMWCHPFMHPQTYCCYLVVLYMNVLLEEHVWQEVGFGSGVGSHLFFFAVRLHLGKCCVSLLLLHASMVGVIMEFLFAVRMEGNNLSRAILTLYIFTNCRPATSSGVNASSSLYRISSLAGQLLCWALAWSHHVPPPPHWG